MPYDALHYTYENEIRCPLVKAPQATAIGPLLISSPPSHPWTMYTTRVVTARVLLHPQCFCYVPSGSITSLVVLLHPHRRWYYYFYMVVQATRRSYNLQMSYLAAPLSSFQCKVKHVHQPFSFISSFTCTCTTYFKMMMMMIMMMTCTTAKLCYFYL